MMPPHASTIVHLLSLAYLAHAFTPSRVQQHPSSSSACRTADRSLPPSPLHASAAPRTAESKSSSTVRKQSSAPQAKRKSANSSKRKPHDRTIDRRKSPALWRDDFEYSIAPASDEVTTNSNNNDNNNQQPSTTTSSNTKKQLHLKGPPELMSPAGGWPQLKAAVANGADAVYLGMTSYSARARAVNFDPDPTLLWREDDDDALEDKLEAAARGGRVTKGRAKKKDGDTISSIEEYEPPADGTPAPLIRAVQFAHRHNTRVYVTFNTLVFDTELHEVQGLIEQVWECGVDALIIQDVGVAKIVTEVVNRMKRLGPGLGLGGMPLEIHASTQQTVTCADGVSFAAETTNATRVVVGRELSLEEITQISLNTPTEIEAFVHGALCVSYSGQCFSSEAWGGRSANRGQCAQACRLPYGLIANGQLEHLSFDGIEGIMGANRGGNDEIQYLLSPQDLCGLEQVEGLVAAGVSCLKIEGRLKDASYVAATTRAYRQAIDAAWNKVLEERSGNTQHYSSPQRMISSPDEHVSRLDLTHVFARGQDEKHDGLTPGFFEGPKHQSLVRGRSPRHRGTHVGRVVSSDRGALIVRLDDHLDDQADFPLKRGDGIVIDRGMAQEIELGGPIYDVKFGEGKAAIRFGREVERLWKDNDKRGYPSMTPKGSHVWKTADAEIGKRMRRLAELNPPKSAAKVTVAGRIGEHLTVHIIDEISGNVGVASSSELGVLEEATGSAINAKSIKKAIGTLGNSRWGLSDLDLSQVEDGLWCPMSWVKDTRRRALESLEGSFGDVTDGMLTTHEVPDPSTVNDELVVDMLLDKMSDDTTTSTSQGKTKTTRTKLSVLARNYDQVDAICSMMEHMDYFSEQAGISEVIVDFLEIEGIRAAVSRIREVNDLRVVVASPRIIKPGEEGIWRTLLKTNPDGILVRSTGLLYRLTQLGGAGKRVSIKSMEAGETIEVTIPELIGDFSLNAANAISAYELLQSGLSRITAAYDLNANAITELATLLEGKASQLEVVVHQHMPIFHTEHCVFARFLSKGDSYQDCGHVCTRNTVHLRDQNGKDNLVLADMGCRNTVFMSEAQSGVYNMDEWVKAGISHLRIELVDESGADAVSLVTSYLQTLTKEKQAVDVWNVLQAIPDSNGRLGGVGVGSLRNAAERRSGELSSSVH